MRIIHSIHSIADQATGPSQAVHGFCDSLIKEGHDVTLATLDWAPMVSSPAYLKTFSLGFGPKRLGRSPAMKSWLQEKVASREVDIFHSHSLWMMPTIYPGHLARKYGVPFVVSPHGTFSQYAMASGSRLKRIYWPLVQRPALRAVSCFHATGDLEYLDIRGLGFSQPVAVIPNGVEVPRNYCRAENSERRTLLYLGRLHEEKGVDTLLYAWKVVAEKFPEWELKIVGPDRGHLGVLKALTEKLGLARIQFETELYGEAKDIEYSSADLYVIPSISENFAITVAEALANGTPVIATKGTPWSALEARDVGWWIDLGVDPLIGCLENVLKIPRSKLQEMGLRGREWIKDEFSWAKVATKIATTYKWIISGVGKPDFIITC
ncbi:MAG: glycosyltransferase [Syntrophobacteraceae bacterium]|jgi:glycosyltransferase involved in cell wall biosynthesis